MPKKQLTAFKKGLVEGEIASEISEKKPDTKTSAALQKNFDDLFKQEALDGKKQDRKERLKYARNIFLMVSFWLLAILSFIFFQGIQKVPICKHPFNLSDKVLITLITSTTVNVVTFFTIVVKYLFPNPLSDKEKKAKEKKVKKETGGGK